MTKKVAVHMSDGSIQPVLTDREFKKISAFVYDVCGIKLPPIKKTMLSARLQKRLRQLRITSFSDYFSYVLSPEGRAHELPLMIDVVSTNKTDFFREAKHFDVLTTRVLPDFVKRFAQGNRKLLRVWSAGCSSGEEPYTLAMVLDDFFSKVAGIDFSILATDICTEVLAKAEKAVYHDAGLEPIPTRFRYKYLMRGKGQQKGYHRVVPELRRKVSFQRLNFMDKCFAIDHKMDIIFCRNVIIYFDKKTQADLFAKFREQFMAYGYLFIGHSESLEGPAGQMERVASAVYKCVK